MDTLSNIPEEIVESIFKMLPAHSLWHCLAVSKNWRCFANQKRLWISHCKDIGVRDKELKYGVHNFNGILKVYDEDNENDNNEIALCNEAFNWGIRTKYMDGWRRKKYKLLNWPRHNERKAYKVHGNRLAVHTENTIHIYLIKDEGTLKVDTIHIPWDCFFEYRLIELNSSYIIVGFNNVLLVYEHENTYFLKMAIVFDRGAEVVWRNIDDYVDKGRKVYFVDILKIIRLNPQSLWVRVKYLNFHTTYFFVDLPSGESTHLFPYRNIKYLGEGEELLFFREEETHVLLMSARSGQLINRLHVDSFCSLAGNDKMMAIIYPEMISFFDIAAYKKVGFVPLKTFSKFTVVNPVDDVLYCINEDQGARKEILSCYCMRSSELKWTCFLTFRIPTYFSSKLMTITVLYGKFIVVKMGETHPFYSKRVQQKEYYVFDASCGELLYQQSYDKFLLFTGVYLGDKNYLRSIASNSIKY